MRRLLAVLFAAVLVASACSAVQSHANAAVVNGDAISRSSLDGELSDMADNRQFVAALDAQQGGPGPVQATVHGTFSQSFVAFALTRRIEYLLIHQELVRRHALPDAAAVSAAQGETAQAYTATLPGQSQPTQLLRGFPAGYQTTLVARQADFDALARSLVKTNVSDQDVRQYYDTHPGSFLTEMCVRHISVADQAAAQRVASALAGGADFAAVARANSTDTGTSASGGTVKGSAPDGCLDGQDLSGLDSQLVSTLAALPIGQPSQPLASQAGYDVVEVTSRRVAPFDASAQQAARQALTQPSQQDVAALFDSLVQRARVSVDPAFGTFQKQTADGPAVVPPTGPQLSSPTPSAAP